MIKLKIYSRKIGSNFLTMFLPHGITLIFLFFLIQNIFQGVYTVGDFSYYLGNMNQLLNCTLGLVSSISDIIQQRIKLEHYDKFKNWKPLIASSGNNEKVNEFHSLEFDHVCFRYPNTNKYVLCDISFKINKGDKIGLVGKNGCGKSTLIKLILCLYQPSSGTILLNGKNILEYDLQSYRLLVSEMLQDYVNYSFSLKENITSANITKTVSDEQIIEACKMSDSYSFVKNWPNGLDTCLTKSFDMDGIELSGGQWQKISLARFFYKQASLYIMDEPSASLDIESESIVFDNVINSLPCSTILLVSHRLSNIKMMDSIIVLEDGKIVERGSHIELMKSDGVYSRLYNLQLEKFQ